MVFERLKCDCGGDPGLLGVRSTQSRRSEKRGDTRDEYLGSNLKDMVALELEAEWIRLARFVQPVYTFIQPSGCLQTGLLVSPMTVSGKGDLGERESAWDWFLYVLALGKRIWTR